jgi:CspA family cold shock protein
MRRPRAGKEQVMPTGKVRFYDEEKGFGFIHGDDGEQVYVHASVLPEGAEITAGTRLEYGVADGRRGPQALSVRVLDAPARAARRNRKSADEMAVIVEDLVKMLDGIGGRLKSGQYPDRQASRQVATILRRVADDIDA